MGRSEGRPVAVPTVNASALVTPLTVAKRNFIVGKPSPAGCYRCIRNTGWYRWADIADSCGRSSRLAARRSDSSLSTFHPTALEWEREIVPPACLDSRAHDATVPRRSMPFPGATRKSRPYRTLRRFTCIPIWPSTPAYPIAHAIERREPHRAFRPVGFSASNPTRPRSQKPIAPETMKPLNWPPARMSVSGKSLYFWFTHSSFASTFGVTNQPPPS